MKFNTQLFVYASLLIIVCFLSQFSTAAPLESQQKLRQKRSPYLRLDELSTKLYLARNKLGGGLIDPLEIGKRSAEPIEDVESKETNAEVNFALTLYESIEECLAIEHCAKSLKFMLKN